MKTRLQISTEQARRRQKSWRWPQQHQLPPTHPNKLTLAFKFFFFAAFAVNAYLWLNPSSLSRGWLRSIPQSFSDVFILNSYPTLPWADAEDAKESFKIAKKKPSGRFLHITDLHVDPNYLKGSDPSQYCHRFSRDRAKNTAGEFGSLNSECDTPPKLVDSFFDALHPWADLVDFVIYTGDSARHNRDSKLPRRPDMVWEDHRRIVSHLETVFVSRGVPVVPSIGNNDLAVHDYMTPGPSSDLRMLADLWKPLNLSLSQSETFSKGGYFRYQLPSSAAPGNETVWIVSLNTMLLFTENSAGSFCQQNSSPGRRMLAWLSKTLKSASSLGVGVFISGHVPPKGPRGRKLYHLPCLLRYIEIAGEFSTTIKGHFFGHTNADFFSIIYRDDHRLAPGEGEGEGESEEEEEGTTEGKDLRRPRSMYHLATFTEHLADFPDVSFDRISVVGAIMGAPSVLAVLNPGFRLYEYDPDRRGELRDYVQYFTPFDLELERSVMSHNSKSKHNREIDPPGDADTEVSVSPLKFIPEYRFTSAYQVAELGKGDGGGLRELAAKLARRKGGVNRLYRKHMWVSSTTAIAASAPSS